MAQLTSGLYLQRWSPKASGLTSRGEDPGSSAIFLFGRVCGQWNQGADLTVSKNLMKGQVRG